MINKKYIEENDLELFEDSFALPDYDYSAWELFEASTDPTGIVDGVNVLARAVGPAGVLDGKSQNSRYYEARLWRRVIKEAQETINRGQMLGTVGHGTPLDDSAIQEGKISHRISKAWIDENKKVVMAEFLILNTPAGRNLNAMLRGGVQMPCSSRGYGKYSGQMEDGTRIVDSDSYKLEGWDWVRVPGIPSAIPKLVESKDKDEDKTYDKSDKKSFSAFLKKKDNSDDYCYDDKDKNKCNTKKDKDDDDDDTKSADKPRGRKKDKDEPRMYSSTHHQPEEVTAQQRKTPQLEQRKVTNMEDTAVVLNKMTEEKIRLEENLRQALETNARLEEHIKALKGQIDEQAAALAGYRHLGTAEDISRVMDVTETMLHNRPVEESDFIQLREQLDIYEELGTPEELEQLFDKFETFMNQYEELGTPNDLNRALDMSASLLEGYSDLGSPVDINEAFDAVENFMGEMNQLGTIAELHAICDLLEAYQEFGTPNELKRAFEMMNTLVETTQRQHVQAESRAIASEFGVDQSIAESMIITMGATKTRETLGAINESRSVAMRYMAPAKGTKAGSLNESKEGRMNEGYQSVMSRTIFSSTPTSRGQRLIEKMSK